MLAGSHICLGFAPSVHGSCHDAASHHQESNQLSHYRGWGMGRWGAPLRDHLWQGPPVTRNAEIDPGDNDPPPKMTQGVMTPPNPPSSPSTASLSGVARCWHSNAYFSLFSSLLFFDPPNRFVSLFSSLFFFDPPNRFVQIPRDLS